jgi:hypothetical protein
MSIPSSITPLFNSGSSAAALQVSRSLRFNSADSAYFSRTPGTAGNRRTWTWSGWVKRSALGVSQALFEANPTGGATYTLFWFDSSDKLQVLEDQGGGGIYSPVTSAVYRDTSAWYHLVLAIDTTLATSTDRIKIYVNGVLQTLTGGFPSLNHDTYINATNQHRIGYRINNSSAFSGYLANIHFIDGQALTPSSFTETDATTGQLIPKTYTGSYGTNGFNLLFADNSSNTAATLGKDSSPNGNNWTPNNLSVTAGAGNDSLVDSPTNYGTDTYVGGEVRGNYATLNNLKSSYTGGTVTVSNGNLDFSANMSANQITSPATIGVSSGKWYWEITCNSITKQYGTDGAVGISINGDIDNGLPAPSVVRWYVDDGLFYNGASSAAYGASWQAGDIIGVALNLDAGTLSFYKNNSSQGQATSGLTGTWFPIVASNNVVSFSANYGARAFAYTAPSGFKALNTQNLPEGTITTSGSFTGNANANGPFVYLNGVPTAMTINSNAVTFATHADKLSNGFKVRSSNASYNISGSNTYSITTTGDKFKYARAQPNP